MTDMTDMTDAPMNEEGRLLAEQERARQAQELAEHPLFKESLATYRERLMTQWAESPARDTEGREKLWLMLKTAEAVERHLVELMETGKLASIQLEQRRSLAQRAREALRGLW